MGNPYSSASERAEAPIVSRAQIASKKAFCVGLSLPSMYIT
jgi:hypothetical protein